MTHTTKKWLLRGLVGLLILIVIWGLWRHFSPKETAPDYITASVEVGDIEKTVLAQGKLEASRQVAVGAQVSGEVTRLHVAVGDRVRAGDIIAQINPATQQNSLENTKASLQQAGAEVTSSQALLAQAESRMLRLQSLLAIDAISVQEFEAAQTEVVTATARLQGAVAAQDKARAEVDTAQQNLSQTRILAPMNGTVISVATEQGQTINANQSAPTLVTLANLETLRVKVQISEADVIHVQAGMPVYFTLLGDPDTRYTASLDSLDPAPQSTSDSAIYYMGHFDIDNPGHLRIDMTAQVHIIQQSANDALLLPAAAIHTERGQTHVEVLVEGQTVSRPVEVGINNRVQAQIISGLEAGEVVVLGQSRSERTAPRRPRL